MKKKDVLEVIEKEIAAVQSRETNSGLSRWALVTAGAALTWLLLSYIEQGGFNDRNIAIGLAYFLVLWDFSDILKNILFGQVSENSQRRYLTVFDFKAGIKNFSFFALIFVVDIFLIYNFLPRDYINWIFIFLYALFPLFIACTFLMYFFDIPFRKNLPKLSLSSLYLNCFLLVVATFLIHNAALFIGSFEIIDFKIVLLLLVILFLFKKYLSLVSSDPLFSNLNKLRQDLNFNYIDPDGAFKQADLIIYGRQADHFLQEKMQPIVQGFEKIQKIFGVAEKEISSIETSLGGRPITKNKISQITKRVLMIKEGLDTVETVFDETDASTARLMRYCAIYTSVAPEFKDDIDKLVIEKINNYKTDLRTTANRIQTHSNKITDILSELTGPPN